MAGYILEYYPEYGNSPRHDHTVQALMVSESAEQNTVHHAAGHVETCFNRVE